MSDIRGTLEAVRSSLDQYLQNTKEPRSRGYVLLSNLVDPQGTPYRNADEMLVMYLANIQRETTVSTYRSTRPVEGDRYASVAPPLYVDLYVLFLANFYDDKYAEGLDLISSTISFFQQNPGFTQDSLPALPPSVDRLAFELANLDLTQLNYLLSQAGVKYLPSVYYKVRMLPFQADTLRAEVPAARGVKTPGEPSDDGLQPIGPTGRSGLRADAGEAAEGAAGEASGGDGPSEGEEGR